MGENALTGRAFTFEGLKVALTHHWLVGSAGGERVLFDLHTMFPDAPIYTLVYDERKAPEWCHECDIRTTYLQKIPTAKSHHQMLLPLMPRAWEALDLTGFDLVISSCASCGKGVITRPDALHVCYCHSPIRYVWDLYYEYQRSAGAVKGAAMRGIIHDLRQWDYLAAQRVDLFVSNSNYVAKRISKYYGRDSVTVNPSVIPNPNPVVEEPLDYYLVVSRFVRYKRVDLAIEACNILGRELIVVGSGGEEEERLRQLAGPTVHFLGGIPDEEVQALYSCARAFLFPGVEDFGITPVESMAAGTPVIAYEAGGALETVEDGLTGLFFDEQTPEALAACIRRFEQDGVELSRPQIRLRSERFSARRFRSEMSAVIERGLRERGLI